MAKLQDLNSAKEHKKKPDEYWQRILGSNETKIDQLGSAGVQHVWHGPGQDNHSDAQCRHRGGSVLSAKGVAEMTFMDGNERFIPNEYFHSPKVWQEKNFPTSQ